MIPQTPWLERVFNFNFPLSDFPVIFSRLEGTLFRLHGLLQTADEEQCSKAGEGWSVKEHLGHLYDLEALWWQRLLDFQTGKEVLSAADMTNQKTKEARHNERPLEQLLLQFTAERQRILETIYPFDEAMLGKTALHPRLNVPLRLLDSLFFVAEHDDHHLTHISRLLRKPLG